MVPRQQNPTSRPLKASLLASKFSKSTTFCSCHVPKTKSFWLGVWLFDSVQKASDWVFGCLILYKKLLIGCLVVWVYTKSFWLGVWLFESIQKASDWVFGCLSLYKKLLTGCLVVWFYIKSCWFTHLVFGCQSSGAVWKSRWPSRAFCPNEPYSFCGHKATLNNASALVTVCP